MRHGPVPGAGERGTEWRGSDRRDERRRRLSAQTERHPLQPPHARAGVSAAASERIPTALFGALSAPALPLRISITRGVKQTERLPLQPPHGRAGACVGASERIPTALFGALSAPALPLRISITGV